MAGNVMELRIVLEHADTKSEKQKVLDNTTAGNKNINSNNSGTSKADIIKKSAATTMAIRGAEKVVKDVVSYALQAPGSIYNDQAKQNEINNIVSSGNMLKNIGSAAISGALIGGPVGAVLGTTIAVVNEALNVGKNRIQYEMKQNEYTINNVRSSEALGRTSADGNR